MAIDAAIVGSGPNGLAAAITLARAGLEVVVYERDREPGGGIRSGPLTGRGTVHDLCSAVHPLAVASPFFVGEGIGAGVDWFASPSAVAHPLQDAEAVVLERSLDSTVRRLAAREGRRYRRLMEPLVDRLQPLLETVLAPLLRRPPHPGTALRFGIRGAVPAASISAWLGPRAGALFAGIAGHSVLPLGRPPSAGVGLLLAAVAHTAGWPAPRGGAGRIADFLVGRCRDLGVALRLDTEVTSLHELGKPGLVLLDVAPPAASRIVGGGWPTGYHRALSRFRFGPGVCKVDYLLAGPLPWRDASCADAMTVHLGGSARTVARGEASVFRGRPAESPLVIAVQPSRWDQSRAPAGQHILWAYAHVPHGWPHDESAAIEAQIERFAPGFRDLIVSRHVETAVDVARRNPNYVGGDIGSGIMSLRQIIIRPTLFPGAYRTPDPRVFLCSSSTPPGGGVHGMCGHLAARAALQSLGR